MASPTTAMVLAAGMGTRMRPLTSDRPKALVEVGGKALIDHMLDRLAAAGVARAVVNVHAFADLLEAHLKARRDLEIVISDERADLLETGGGLKKAREKLGDEPILVANINSVWREDAPAIASLAAAWDPARMDDLLLLAPLDRSLGFDGPGDFFRAGDGRLSHRGEAVSAPLAYMGVHMLDPRLIDGWPKSAHSIFGHWMAMQAAGRLHGVVLEGRWMHVGDPAARDAAEQALSKIPSPGEKPRRGPAQMNFLAAPSPRWFNIPAQRPFLADFAAGLAGVLAPLGPEAVAQAQILLPTRRAGRALERAFIDAWPGTAALLPQIRALGDLDEDEPPFEAGEEALELPPAISPERRRFELARLVMENEGLLERRLDAGGALEMADALAAFLDACQMEETGDPDRLAGLVEGDLAEHWRVSAQFLALALEAWPLRLQALGLVDITTRRVALLRHLARRWKAAPPEGIVVAGGSTGTADATADLLAAIAAAPQGAVVLPGLDLSLADQAWADVDDQHPQGSLKRLLAHASIERGDVRDWGAARFSAAGRWRGRLINEALRPAEATADWLGLIAEIGREGATEGVDPIALGLQGLNVVAARTEEEAASVAALLLREALETPDKTAALITPDALLARRVSARLTRWGVTADSSAGQALAGAPAAVLMSLLARSAADPTDPVSLLAILKNPLTRLGLGGAELDRRRRTLEREGLRGPRADGWEGLNARLQQRLVEASTGDGPSPALAAALVGAIELAALLRAALDLLLVPYTGETATPAEAARALAAGLETVARGPGGGPGELWAGQAGEGLGKVLAALIGESEGLPEVTRAGFAELIDGLLARERLRPGGASHPRLKILGVLEGRLISADRLILAGLEEGVWPQGAPIDPFLSRPMRAELGLPPPERRIGLSAHDFAQAAAASEVILLHSERRGAAPAIASRWLWRLRVLAQGAGVALPGRGDILAWARALDAPLSPPPPGLATASRPAPTPPVEARPRTMGVTAVERWIRDPYAIYARDILRLRPLERPDESVDALVRGTAVHRALERFTRDHPDHLPDDAEGEFERLLVACLREAGMAEASLAREHALAANLAGWISDFERRRRPGALVLVEQSGALTLDAPGGPFTISAKADRLERRQEACDILDFKTGAAPSAAQMRAGLSPQLTLTAAILAAGGFAALGPAAPGDLVYVRVTGRRIPGIEELRATSDESAGLAVDALDGLSRRIAWFDEVQTPYRSWATPQFIGRFGGDYDHLARLWEWRVIADAEEAFD